MFPFIPVPVESGMAFKSIVTGEVLAFDSSWFAALDRVEQILWDNHNGNYIEL